MPAARADPPPPIECSPGWPNRCNVEIEAGEGARFDGVLMSPDLAIFLGQSTEATQDRVDAAVTATAAVWRENIKQARRDERADRRVIEVERDALRRELDAQPNVWLWAGLAAAGAATIVTVLYVSTGAGERLRDAVAGER